MFRILSVFNKEIHKKTILGQAPMILSGNAYHAENYCEYSLLKVKSVQKKHKYFDCGYVALGIDDMSGYGMVLGLVLMTKKQRWCQHR